MERYFDQWDEAIAFNMKDFMEEEPGIIYARKFLTHRLSRSFKYFSENQKRTNIVLRIGVGVNEVFEQVIIRLEERVLGSIMHDIKLGKKQGHIPEDLNTEFVANAVLGAIYRTSYYYFVLKKGSIRDLSTDEMIKTISGIMLDVLKMS